MFCSKCGASLAEITGSSNYNHAGPLSGRHNFCYLSKPENQGRSPTVLWIEDDETGYGG